MEEKMLPKLLVSREEARGKLEPRIEKGQQLRERQIGSEDELDDVRVEAKNWSDYNDDLLIRLFSQEPAVGYMKFYYHRLSAQEIIDIMDTEPFILDWFQYQLNEYKTEIADSINSLESIRDRLELFAVPSDFPHCTFGNGEFSDTPESTFGSEVFIVHGHDDGAKANVARFVEHLGIKPIILHEQPNRGLTIIEKIEKYSRNAGFAIVLLTPDDIGALNDNSNDESNTRARQNVVFELGYFMGKLGRERVCPLFKGEIEKPSDIDGIVYVPMDNADGWQLKLAKEMKQAGLPIDPEKLL